MEELDNGRTKPLICKVILGRVMEKGNVCTSAMSTAGCLIDDVGESDELTGRETLNGREGMVNLLKDGGAGLMAVACASMRRCFDSLEDVICMLSSVT